LGFETLGGKKMRAFIVKREFGGMENGQASVSMRFTGKGKVAVVRYLPAGMDIAPEVYGRFESIDAAMPAFEQASADVIGMGFAPAY
jgi:hypothetical protein